jgi:predicted transcriptional regulator of viral defense system
LDRDRVAIVTELFQRVTHMPQLSIHHSGMDSEAHHESDNMRRSHRQPWVDAAISALGTDQHTVFGLDQLAELGLSARAVQHRAARGRLHRLHRAVYGLVPRELLTREGHWMAAVLSFGDRAVVSHRTAAVLHGLMQYNGAKTDITVPGRRSWRRGNLIVHGSTTLTDDDVTVENGVPCTTIARTLFDLGDVVERRRHERAFDQAEIMGEFDLLAIDDQLERNATRPAAAKTRAILSEHYISSTPTESELEEAFFALCRRIGVPEPEVQQWIMLPDGGDPIRADFVWREQRVVVEVDGDRYHRTAQSQSRDRRKDQRLTVHAYIPVRTDARQIFYAPAELAATLKQLVTASIRWRLTRR